MLLAGVAVALAATAPASTKEGIRAKLDSPEALRRAPGEAITVGRTLEGLDRGERFPFNAEGIFVRLRDASGGDSVTALAKQGPLGHYVADIAVPDGGLGEIDIGLLGRVERNGVSEPSEVIFPIVNDPLAERAPQASVRATEASSGGTLSPLLAIVVAAAGGALAPLAAMKLHPRSRAGRALDRRRLGRSLEP